MNGKGIGDPRGLQKRLSRHDCHSPSCFYFLPPFLDRSPKVNPELISSEKGQPFNRIRPQVCAYKVKASRVGWLGERKEHKYELFTYRLLLYMDMTRKSCQFGQVGESV